MTITILGIAAFIFVAVFTHRAYNAGHNPRQAIIEAWANIVIGFSINFVANFLILPLVDAHITVAQNFWMGWLYTAVSICRQYAIRRWFQKRIHTIAEKLA